MSVDGYSEQVEAATEALTTACRAAGVWPYFVKGGFMITPVLDVDEASLAVALQRLVAAVRMVARSMWQIKALGFGRSLASSLATNQTVRPTSESGRHAKDSPGLSVGTMMTSAL